MPVMLGAMSEMMRSNFSPASHSITCPTIFSSVKSPWMKSVFTTGSMGRISVASTRPFLPTSLPATCDQPPGADPRSITRMPGLISRSLSLSSMSLYADRER
jgi:hypothetical protein